MSIRTSGLPVMCEFNKPGLLGAQLFAQISEPETVLLINSLRHQGSGFPHPICGPPSSQTHIWQLQTSTPSSAPTRMSCVPCLYSVLSLMSHCHIRSQLSNHTTFYLRPSLSPLLLVTPVHWCWAFVFWSILETLQESAISLSLSM